MNILFTILGVLLFAAIFNPFREDWGKVRRTAQRNYGRGYMTPKEYDAYCKPGETVAWVIIIGGILLLVFVV
jgi:hypothetical protein